MSFINSILKVFVGDKSQQDVKALQGNITKIKLGISNQYAVDELRQKIENILVTIKAGLEEGVVGGGGSFYLFLTD
jgi:preprotein translocase subunit SecA